MNATDSFTHQGQPSRVVFGTGRLKELGEETARSGMRRALVLSTPTQRRLADRAVDVLGPLAVGAFCEARMHVPTEVVADACRMLDEVDADGCVAVGGGSTIGLGKAIALRTGVPVIAVPTTYSGSEMTPIWGLTEANHKRTGRDPVVLPRCVVYDPELTLDLPAAISGTSGINAIAHAVESLYAPDTSPVVALLAEEGIRCLAQALPQITADPSNREARSLALRGAWLCGCCLGAATMSLHHKLCHVLGGMLDLPHAPTHAVVLPHVAAFNLAATPGAQNAVQRALGDGDPAHALTELAAAVGAPGSLAELGVTESALVQVTEQVLAQPYANPRPVNRSDVESILHAALIGSPPK